MHAICEMACPNYGYRRVTAELRHRDFVVNSKKVRRIMREQALSPKRKRRYVATTNSDHDSPIHPNVARGLKVYGPDNSGSVTSPLSLSRWVLSIWRSFSMPGHARLSAMHSVKIPTPD
ncbi:MAG: IS3 family transposase [Shinella sp.]|uniref:IS3 family transposase n=1 Tax=Shinella sp. TaxID=1870904 RepID=UPI0040353621